jgi:thioredoxin 1
MTIIHLNKENFDKEILKSKTPAIIDFYADWCGPCKMMAPVFEKLSNGYTDKLKFCKVNTDEHPEFAQQFEIQGIPALVMVKGNKEIGRIVGFAPEAALKQKIDSLI